MTVTVVFGKTTDGYVSSVHGTYATARAGANLGVNTTDATAPFGQSFSGVNYFMYQAAVGFDFSAVPAGEVVTSAVVRLQVATMNTPATARDMEIRGYAWGPGGLTTTDWRNAANLGVLPAFATVAGANGAGVGKYTYAGSEAMRAAIQSSISMEYMVVSSRERAGTTPTGEEGGAISTADASGTASDPALIFTTAPRSILFGVLGAQVKVPTGWVYLESDGAAAPVISIKHVDPAGAVITFGTLPLGTSAGQFAAPTGAQAFALVAAPGGSFYVVGRAGNAANSLAVQAWVWLDDETPGIGTGDWGSRTVINVPMPAHDSTINQVAGCYQSNAGTDTLLLLAGHTAGTGQATLQPDVAWAIVDVASANVGTALVKGSGNAVGTLSRSTVSAGDFNAFANEVGSGMDVVTDLGNATRAYAYGFRKDQMVGANGQLDLGGLALNGGSTALASTGTVATGYGTKDASGKARVVSCGPGLVAVVSADADTGWGFTVQVYSTSWSSGPGFTLLGSASLSGESITSMPDGPAITGSLAWDVIYSDSDQSIWVYYVDAGNANRLMRTAFSLATYHATRVEKIVANLSYPVKAIRVARDAPAGDLALVCVAMTNGAVLTGANVMDSFNQAPTAPTLTHRDGADATLAVDLAWTFNDPNVTDAQSAFWLVVEDTATGTTAYDTGKVVSTASVRTIPGGTLANGKTYRWRVSTWDQSDLVSPWSDWDTFDTAAGGAVTITSPATDNQPGIATDELIITWTATGTVQAAYRAKLYKTIGDVLVSDSGWVASVVTSRLITGMTSDREHRVEVQVRNSVGVVSNVGTRLITPSFGRPETPEIVLAPHPEEGYMLVTVHNPLPGEPETSSPEYDMESALTGFVGGLGGVFSQSTDQAHGGTHSLKMVADGTQPRYYVRAPSAAVVGGARYRVRAWVYRAVAGPVTMSITWNNPGFISESEFTTTVPAGTWTLISASGTAPDNATGATYGPTLGGNPAAGTTAYADDLLLTAASDRPDAAFNLVLRRPADTTDPWTILGQCPPDGSFRDYTAAANRPYEYMVRGMSA